MFVGIILNCVLCYPVTKWIQLKLRYYDIVILLAPDGIFVPSFQFELRLNLEFIFLCVYQIQTYFNSLVLQNLMCRLCIAQMAWLCNLHLHAES